VRNNWLHACAAFAVMVLPAMIATSVLAKSDTSSLSGAITDSSGAVVPSADHLVQFTFPSLAPGTYSGRVESAGLQTTFPLVETCFMGN
jgi:hypothetical protein